MAHVKRQVVVGERGRLVLPSAVRAKVGIRPGTRLLLTIEPDGSLRLRPYRAIAAQGRGLLAQLASPDRSMVDELLAERRREAARESAE